MRTKNWTMKIKYWKLICLTIGIQKKTPRILINRWYHQLRDNCVLLKNPRESASSNGRKIFYDVDLIGKNFNYFINKNYMNLNIERIKQNWIMILVKFKDVMYNSKLFFFFRNRCINQGK